MGLKVVHINTDEIRKDAAAKALWENVLKPKWEAKARERGEKLLEELTGKKRDAPGDSPDKLRG